MTDKKAQRRKVPQKTATPEKSAAKELETGEFPRPSAAQFSIVGIGASAGGLEAFESFFKAMPDKSGLAFVLVAHLAPSHVSILPELIQKTTEMEVSQVVDNTRVQANHVYIIPPNKTMAIFHGTLQLLDLPTPRGPNLPIDIFFRSLAQDIGHKAIGIILSGTGTDGTLGIRAIKGEAGMVMSQSLNSAKYDGMPASAIGTGLVDYVLPPEKMPEQLLRYIHHQDRRVENFISNDDQHYQSALQKIFILLRVATDHDFSLYKKNTINRRIERRMHIHQIDQIDDYVRYLQESDREVDILFKELLIGVTSFFRDAEAFELLKGKYIPDLLEDKPDGYELRIWVPGCSSGEEAYSVAIIVQECIEPLKRHFDVQIFGTDLDEDAIDAARTGLYPKAISADISEERLSKFFSKEGDHYQIRKNIREMVVFAPQNIIKDPPFTKLDMLSCRNLLIYFRPELQRRLLPMFHYSLKEDGILFLGSSETIGQSTDLFSLLDKKWKIFKRHPSKKATLPMLDFQDLDQPADIPDKKMLETLKPNREIDIKRLLKVILAQSDIPACVIIDDHANIVYIHGQTGRFLELAQGEMSINILEMARLGLRVALTNAIRKMASDRREVIMNGLQIKEKGTQVNLNLIVRPLPDLKTGHRGMMMVIFDEIPAAAETGADTAKQVRKKKGAEVKRLEDELQHTRENLQTTIEELETSNEELKSTNEELQSTNEELQSTNEELETSKEELQSLNEESVTVNAELQCRIDELIAANDDIKNLLDATDIATVFLDIHLKIRRFTPRVTDMFHLTHSDIGRPIEHFATTLTDLKVKDYALKVLEDLAQREVEVVDSRGRVYCMRARPYRTLDNVIDGVVITFSDITEHKILTRKAVESEEKWRGVVENAPLGIFFESEGQFIYINPYGLDLFGAVSSELILGTRSLDRVHPDQYKRIKKRNASLYKGNKPLPAVEETWLRMDGGDFEVVVSAVPMTMDGKAGALFFFREKQPVNVPA